MKHPFCLTISVLFAVNAFSQVVIKAADANKYIGKKVTVFGNLCGWTNSSYFAIGSIFLGPDTAHKQLTIISRGENYIESTQKTWVGNYIGKNVQMTGIVKGDHKTYYLEATDTLKLVQ